MCFLRSKLFRVRTTDTACPMARGSPEIKNVDFETFKAVYQVKFFVCYSSNENVVLNCHSF